MGVAVVEVIGRHPMLDVHGVLGAGLGRALWTKAQRDFGTFLFCFCKTKDEHDPTIYAKPFPLKDYLADLALELQLRRRIAVPKSRQMLVTWAVCAFVLWVALFRDNSLCFIQSKREEDADALLGRVYDLYIRLSRWVRQENPVNPSKDGQRMYCHLSFPWTRARVAAAAKAQGKRPEYALVGTDRAHVWAIPQGADVLRQYTATLIFSDEDAFQEQAGDAYRAAAPTLAPDAWWIKVSSANPGHFESVVTDQPLEVAL